MSQLTPSENHVPTLNRCIQDLFAEQAARTPAAVAVIIGEQQLTYAELNSRANQLANHLRRQGVGAEARVGVCLERSLEMIVGLLGILKAGGAYVPLDPDYPDERLSYMIKDAGVSVVLTEQRWLDTLSKYPVEAIALDSVRDRIENSTDVNPGIQNCADSLAYVMYTSGSTGQPKGVLVPHRGVVRLVNDTNYAQFGPEEVLLQFAPLGFDASTFEIWGSLLNGARLVLAGPEKASLKELGETITRHQVTTLWLTAGLFHQMVEQQLDSLHGVRQLLAGGDVLSVWHVEKARRTLPGCQLINGYGPTENTTFTCCHRVTADEQFESSVPIGLPVSHTEVRILNESMELVSADMAGELHIGGAGLAHGYLNDAALTAARFLPDPLSREPGARLYRTGDRVRRLDSGALEFLGRIDQQVKIRGFRIEPGEIETVLLQHPAVKECVVIPREDRPGDKRLVAYVVQDAANAAGEVDTIYLADWQKLYDETYSQTAGTIDPAFNITGWNSSYTGQPIPAAEMHEWVDHTVARVLALKPKRILEIGSGTGLLLFRLAPHCEAYAATDFSQTVIAQVQEHLQTRPELNHVKLWQREANDLRGFEPQSFDAVVLNSVVQYFPNIDYLVEVISKALTAVRPGGYVFIGDVRNLQLLEAFHASVELFRASSSLPLDTLKTRVRERIEAEDELVIDPRFFSALQQQLPEISSVAVFPKSGRSDNELTRFRYDVVMQVGSGSIGQPPIRWRDWKADSSNLGKLRDLLQQQPEQRLGVRAIGNSRVAAACATVDLLHNDSLLATTADLQHALAEMEVRGGNPEELCSLATSVGYAAQLSWANCDHDGSIDVLFTQSEPGADSFANLPATGISFRSWSEFANQPARKSSFLNLVPRLRSYLREKLPDYMVPSAFVLLEDLPLTANGKIERKKLPPPERARPPLAEEFVAPCDARERALAAIWGEVLGLDRVGVNDNFFELGGHSLLATQVLSRLRETLHSELSLQRFFENPTIAGCIANLPQVETARSANSLQKSGAVRAPLSSGQLRLWFMDQLVPGTAIYNVPAAIHLAPNVDLEALKRSLNEIVQRHEALRTTFDVVDGQPIQEIHPSLELELPIIDLSQLTQSERNAEVARRTHDEAQGSFDLKLGPLLRARILKLSEDDLILLLTMHHMIADGWSWKVLFRELGTIYQAFAQGQSSPLPELPIQYADFVTWQNERLQDQVVEKQLEYWKKQLAGAPFVLELPADHARPAVQSFRGARQTLPLSEALTAQLREFAKREKATLFMTMLAAFKVLLHRYTGQPDILVGSPIANRPRTEYEQLIGFFLNNLVLRTNLSPDSTFREVVQQVSANALAAYANQDVPFEKIVEALNPERDLGRPPIFQAFFNLLNFAEQIDMPGLTRGRLAPVEVWAQPNDPGSQFDLTLYVAEKPESIQMIMLYNSDIFAPERIATMLEQFRHLLTQVVVDPDNSIAAYSLVDPKSRGVLPDPSVRLDEPRLEPITETFMARALQLPDQVALRRGLEAWSYSELAQRARTIASALLGAGVNKGDVVAVGGEPGFDLIAGMLGVFFSGGVLLTLDRNLPSERQQVMLREARAKHLLFNGDWRAEDQWLEAVPSLTITKVKDIVQPDSKADLPVLNPDDAAYLFFTSGTSGVPKGVLGCHKGLSHFLKWQREQFQISPADRSAQFTGLSFDVVLRDIFLPLTSGASLHLPEPEVLESSAQVVHWLKDEQISILHTVPSLAQTWLNDLAAPVSLPTLRWTFFAGEPLTDSLVHRWRAALVGPGNVANLYGPTETTLAKCFFVVPEEPRFGVQPVGTPLPNTQALILNHSQLCGVGESGEITIRTPYRTLGYVNADEEQKNRFIKNTFTDEDDDLLYLSGDRGRYRPDGLIDIMGRLDDQIKIRGVRVEPAEVNAVLSRHPSVLASVVVAIKDANDENALAAYVVGADTAADTVAVVRTHLQKQLPPAMVPAFFVMMDHLPLTPNGKVDRRSLPAPDLSFASLIQESIAPRNQTEELVAGVWSEVLGVEAVGVNHDFFALGGHSLRAMQVISRINAAFQLDLPLRAMFESSTVASLAETIEDRLIEQLEALPEETR